MLVVLAQETGHTDEERNCLTFEGLFIERPNAKYQWGVNWFMVCQPINFSVSSHIFSFD